MRFREFLRVSVLIYAAAATVLAVQFAVRFSTGYAVGTGWVYGSCGTCDQCVRGLWRQQRATAALACAAAGPTASP